jgi:hypothetical protein
VEGGDAGAGVDADGADAAGAAADGAAGVGVAAAGAVGVEAAGAVGALDGGAGVVAAGGLAAGDDEAGAAGAACWARLGASRNDVPRINAKAKTASRPGAKALEIIACFLSPDEAGALPGHYETNAARRQDAARITLASVWSI